MMRSFLLVLLSVTLTLAQPSTAASTRGCEGSAQWSESGEVCACIDGKAICAPPRTTSRGIRSVPCTPGTSFMIECNRCFCTESGRAACTKKFCRDEPPVDLASLPEEVECTEGSSWVDICNRCICTKGKSACTKKRCNPGQYRNAGTCEPGSQWRKDCNICSCTSTGVGRCTLKACIAPGPVKGKSLTVEKDCKFTGEKSRWRKGCNWCSCSERGIGKCTLRACLPGAVIDEPQCEGTAEWFNGDQWCRCVEGKASCSSQQGPAQGKSLTAEKNCEFTGEKSRWRKGCNWCSCSETGIGKCTLRACMPGAVIDEPECEGTAEWFNGDQWCTCVEGKASCTSQQDEKPVDLASLPKEVECTEGSSWNDICNRCICTKGKSACTKKRCDPGQYRDAGKCDPGSQWRKDCNICSCTSTGVGRCTLKGCIAPGQVKGRSLTVQKDCKFTGEKSRWRKGCNWCSCSETGIGKCTLRACRPGAVIDDPECEGTAEWFNGDQWCKCVKGKASCSSQQDTRVDLSSLPQEVECTEGSSWIDVCNRCICSEGKSICVKKRCNPGQHKDAGTCDAGSQWRKDCNICSCSSTGVGRCTLKACLAPGPAKGKSLTVEKDCKFTGEKSRWRKGCNWCSCSETGIGKCSLRACLPGAVIDEPECEGTAEWFNGDQWCRCVEGKASCPSQQDTRVDLSSLPQEVECTEGSSWVDVCNWCICSNGKSLCTKKRCNPAGQHRDAGKCDAGSQWRKDCNICSCSSTGVGRCTLKACIAPGPVQGRSLAADKNCKFTGEKSRWRNGCNWCSCSETGVGKCTLRACLPGAVIDEPECEENAEWLKGDQWCTCVKGKASCKSDLTRGADLSLLPKDVECTEGSSWTKVCNRCQCVKGKAACTKMGCPPGHHRHAGSCKPGSQWRKDCNICTCTSGGVGMCTLKGCVKIQRKASVAPEKPMIEKQCKHTEEPSSWRKDCNWCTCGPTGVGLCTIKGCLKGVEIDLPECKGPAEWRDGQNWCACVNGKASCKPKPVRPSMTLESMSTSVECIEGSSWTSGCNTCKCVNQKRTCTKKKCRSGEELAPPSCEPNSQWRSDCNICTCSETGVAMCTLKACRPAQRQRTVAKSQVSSEVQCKHTKEPSRWRKNCNWCSCAETGVGMCTLKGCLPGAVIDLPECEGPAEWKRNDEWCDCIDGKAACKPISTNDLKPIQRTCIPTSKKSSWKKDCNWCRCLEGGVEACTKKLCRKGRQHVARDDEPDCTEDAIWKRDDEQWCSCENGRSSCDAKEPEETESDSSTTPAVSPTKECTPNTTADNACNVCHCSDKGDAYCTLAICQPVAPPTPRESIPKHRTCFRLGELSRWKEECNWCRCSSTGKGLCTRKLCKPGRRDSSDKECEPNAIWKRNGNWCQCMNETADCGDHVQVPAESIDLNKPIENRICSPGSRWRKLCNWCTCSVDGFSAACTETECLPGTEKSLEAFMECEAQSEWKDGRQWCKCLHGKRQCQNINEDLTQRTGSSGIEKRCRFTAEEDAWKDDCNWCSCSKADRSICTKMTCFEKSTVEEKGECKGSPQWMKDECNWCNCTNALSNCTSYNCTLLTEPVEYPADTDCIAHTEESRWRNICNWCNCRHGKSMCTKKKCLHAASQRYQDEPQCHGHLQWKVDCNRCYCENGTAACTKNICGESGSKKACREGQTWVEKCNTCYCRNGEEYCTMDNCDTGIQAEVSKISEMMLVDHASELKALASRARSAEVYPCKTGSQWKIDCNWCTCQYGMSVCNTTTCSQGEIEKGPMCTPGSKWMTSCHMCICADGLPVCTATNCLIKTRIDSSDPNTLCKENSRWKEECNWCHCVQGEPFCGKAMCTYTEPTTAIQCEGDAEWRKDNCTWCVCRNNLAECTTSTACLGHQQPVADPIPETSDFCVVGRRFKRGCNWCTCPAPSIEICTLIACTTRSALQSDSLPADSRSEIARDEPIGCTSGDTWSQLNEICTCISQITICSRSHLPIISGRSNRCDDVQSFRDDCNTCFCIDGKTACTRQACTPSDSKPTFCILPPVDPAKTQCEALIPSWTYNATTQECQQYNYGGCNGSENLFSTQEECVSTCEAP